MKTLKLHKSLLATAVGAVLALGMTSNALALPQFQVDPPGPLTQFYATSINGDSSERLIGNSGAGTLSTAFGYLAFSGFSNTGPLGTTGTLPGIDTGLGTTYQLYLTYNLVANYTGGGAFGTAGSNYSLSALNFNVYRDDGLLTPALRTHFTAATTTTDSSITQFADDVLLGNGSLLFGVAGIDSLSGAFLNSTTSYANNAAGNLFFVDPSPFYSLAFNAFNNTSQGVVISGACAPDCTIAINAAGLVDFNQVPEPTTVALLGLGLLGLGLSRRRKDA